MTDLESIPNLKETEVHGRVENPEQVQQQLVEGAQEVYNSITFESKNTRMAETVANISAPFAASSIGITEQDLQQEMRKSFVKMGQEAGAKFASSFTETGRQILNNTMQYELAASGRSASEPVVEHLPFLLEKLGNQVNLAETIKSANFQDVIRQTASDLGFTLNVLPSAPELISILHQVIPADDYFSKAIDTTQMTEHQPFSIQQQNALNLALRAANVTWMVGQVHRATWEGKTSRIDPEIQEDFSPYDVMKRDMYQRLIEGGLTPHQALIHVAFVAFKDCDVLKEAFASKLAEAASANPEQHPA